MVNERFSEKKYFNAIVVAYRCRRNNRRRTGGEILRTMRSIIIKSVSLVARHDVCDRVRVREWILEHYDVPACSVLAAISYNIITLVIDVKKFRERLCENICSRRTVNNQVVAMSNWRAYTDVNECDISWLFVLERLSRLFRSQSKV